MVQSYPAYRGLLESGELQSRAQEAVESMQRCMLCARHCRVNRVHSLRGAACRTGRRAIVTCHHPHHGEELPIRGTRGSGTIFFAWCNLRCVFCQNWQVSQQGVGIEVDAEQLAGMMLDLQQRGCHNINLVSPSHVIAQILEALVLAAQRGLRLPLVYNTGGYDSCEGLRLLDGIVDIYMPDMKFGDSRAGRLYSRVRDYTSVNRAAVKEMRRQVGDLVLDDEGVAVRGLLVRHLVLPGGLANTGKVMKFLADEVSPRTFVQLMGGYRPCYRAADHPPLDRGVTDAEIRRAQGLAAKYGIRPHLDGLEGGVAIPC